MIFFFSLYFAPSTPKLGDVTREKIVFISQFVFSLFHSFLHTFLIITTYYLLVIIKFELKSGQTQLCNKFYIERKSSDVMIVNESTIVGRHVASAVTWYPDPRLCVVY